MVNGNASYPIWLFAILYDPSVRRRHIVKKLDTITGYPGDVGRWFNAVCDSENLLRDRQNPYEKELLEFNVTSSYRPLFEFNNTFNDFYFLCLGTERLYWYIDHNTKTRTGRRVNVTRGNDQHDYIDQMVEEFKRVFVITQ